MSRSPFGWSLPPGCTHKMIEDQFAEGPCAVCALAVDDCVCHECPVCHSHGDPICYRGPHGLRLSKQQAISRQKARIWTAKERVQDEEFALHQYQSADDKQEWDIDDVADPWG